MIKPKTRKSYHNADIAHLSNINYKYILRCILVYKHDLHKRLHFLNAKNFGITKIEILLFVL